MGSVEQRMSRRSVTVKDVPADEFIKAAAEFLKRQPKFDVPKYHDIVKTGTIKEFAPYDEDWFYVRSASILRKVYLRKGTVWVHSRSGMAVRMEHTGVPAKLTLRLQVV